MNLLLGFAPFAAFALLSHAFSANAGLLAGALVSAALVVREIVAGRAPKILELGTLLLFALLSAWSVATEANWPLMQVRLMVDAGLLLIVLGSLLIGKPFTLQYAREGVPAEHWNAPLFLEVNRQITMRWLIAFGVMVIADLILLLAPQVSPHVGIALTVAALAWALMQTKKLSGRAKTDGRGFSK